jgi:hypothetical protein
MSSQDLGLEELREAYDRIAALANDYAEDDSYPTPGPEVADDIREALTGSADSRGARPTYEPARPWQPNGEIWMHSCGHIEHWDGARSDIEDEGCDACEGAPGPGQWRQLHVEVITSA